MAKPNHYLESQRRRIEENKKIMEKLNLSKLAHALKTPTFKKSPGKRKPRLPVDPSSLSLRRSNRVAEKPPTIYKEVPVEPLGRSRSYRSYKRRDLLNRVYASDEVRHFAIDRAGQIQAGLESDVPSFVKPMLQSHVTGGFWLGLPIQFCKAHHLPQEDETIILVDEDGGEFPTKFLAAKHGLSGGWRGFSIDHQLVDGDALVFQLVKPTEFKVYIIRAYKSEDNAENQENEKDLDVTPLRRSSRRSKARAIPA